MLETFLVGEQKKESGELASVAEDDVVGGNGSGDEGADQRHAGDGWVGVGWKMRGLDLPLMSCGL